MADFGALPSHNRPPAGDARGCRSFSARRPDLLSLTVAKRPRRGERLADFALFAGENPRLKRASAFVAARNNQRASEHRACQIADDNIGLWQRDVEVAT